MEKAQGNSRRRRSAEEKWQVFLEAAAKDQPTVEVLGRHGLLPTDLARIREAVRRGALAELSKGPGRAREDAEQRRLRQELLRVEAALKEMSIKVTLLEGKGPRAW
ncbi:MAG: hypothetical protein ACRDXD_03570 [Acidimicrobiia bacterium]